MAELAQQEMQPQEKMHDLRQQIDRIIKYAKSVRDDTRPEYASGKREIALAFTKLQEAKMWVGKVLEEMGSELPVEFRDEHESKND